MNSFRLPNHLAGLACLAGALLSHLPATAQRPKPVRLSAVTRRLFEQGKYPEAQVEIDATLAQDTLNADLIEASARCQMMQTGEGHTAKALAGLDKALRQYPTNALLVVERGFALYKLGRNAESVAALDQALLLAPGQPLILGQRGLSSLFANQLLPGLTDLAQANSLQPRDPDLALGLLVGQLLNGRLAEAQKTADALVTKNPAFAGGYSTRALLHLRRHDAAAARRDADQALRLAPADFGTRLLSALLLQQAGNPAAAQAAYDTLQRETGDPFTVGFERGDLHLLTGDVPAAETEWRAAAALGSQQAASRLAAGFRATP